MNSIKTAISMALLAILALTGSECVFFATSGGDTDRSEEDRGAGLIVIIGDGQLIDAPVQGVRYVSGALSGITGSDGEYRYEIGRTIRFYIGDIPLGEATAGKPVITPLDLVAGGGIDTPAVINVARLLQSLDSVPDDAKITIPASAHAKAVRSHEGLYAAIETLDFADDTRFVNAASQIVAVLTESYPATAVLVDAEQAREHLIESFTRLGVDTSQ